MSVNENIPKQAGRCSGRRTHVAACTRLAKHLGPNSWGRTPCPSTRRIPKQTESRSGLCPHTFGSWSWALFQGTHTMSVAQTQAQRSREVFLAADTGLSPHTLSLRTFGEMSGAAYHVRRLDTCPNKAGRRSGRRTQVCYRTRVAKNVCRNSAERISCPSTNRSHQTSRELSWTTDSVFLLAFALLKT